MNEDGHVLRSRRGLLAAGLAVAVVGALGVASTLNAGAEEIPGTQDAPTATATTDPAPQPSVSDVAGADPATNQGATAEAVATDATPPKLLPWGSRPMPISTGDAGANASTLRADGVDAAPADTSGATVAPPKFAPKGRTAKTSFLKSATTDAPPPDPGPVSVPSSVSPSSPTPAPTSDRPTVNFMYNVGSQAAVTDGFSANVTIAKPKLDKVDYHTLGELALQSADGKQIVEVGWNVDRAVNGDDDPHLFVYHWVNRQTSCYNGCGFQQYSSNIKPGDTLAYDVTKKFGIQYSDGAWWVAFDSEWVGYFPEKLWNDENVAFSKAGYLQVFGEIAASGSTSCTQMGNGQTPDKDTAARASSVSFVNGPAVNLFMRSSTDQYAVAPFTGSLRSFRYGGPVARIADSCKSPAS